MPRFLIKFLINLDSVGYYGKLWTLYLIFFPSTNHIFPHCPFFPNSMFFCSDISISPFCLFTQINVH